MAQSPTPADKWLASTLVGIAAGVIVGRRSGLSGFLISTVAVALAHQAFNAPVAGLIADLT